MKLSKQQLRDILKKGNVTLDYEHSILAKTNRGNLDRLPAAEPEREQCKEPVAAHESAKRGQERGKGGVPLRFRVLLVRCSVRYCDDDNLAASCKAIRDQIAAELAINDGDPAIEWEYEQVRTRGSVGCFIRIERLWT